MKKKMFIFSGIVLIIILISLIVLSLNTRKSEQTIKETQSISEKQIDNKITEDSKIENLLEVTYNEDIQEKTTETIEESPKTETTKEEKVISQPTQKEQKQQTSKPATTTQVTEKPQEVIQGTPKVEEQKVVEPKKEEPVKEPVKQETPKCSGNSHGVGTGNSGKWFNSESEAINYYNSIINDLGKKWENFEIDDETYRKKCPYGYEDWSCPYCGKWTINFYYNK